MNFVSSTRKADIYNKNNSIQTLNRPPGDSISLGVWCPTYVTNAPPQPWAGSLLLPQAEATLWLALLLLLFALP